MPKTQHGNLSQKLNKNQLQQLQKSPGTPKAGSPIQSGSPRTLRTRVIIALRFSVVLHVSMHARKLKDPRLGGFTLNSAMHLLYVLLFQKAWPLTAIANTETNVITKTFNFILVFSTSILTSTTDPLEIAVFKYRILGGCFKCCFNCNGKTSLKQSHLHLFGFPIGVLDFALFNVIGLLPMIFPFISLNACK